MEEDYEASLSSPENDNELLDIQEQPEHEQSGEESDDNITSYQKPPAKPFQHKQKRTGKRNEMKNANKEGILNSAEDIRSRRYRISPVKNQEVIVPPDSDDEEAKTELLRQRKSFLKKAWKVASDMCTKGHILLEALDRPGCSQLQVNELKKLVETTNPIPKSPVVPTPP